ncbi:MAG TPA: YicC/YloC family endoribonuclease [Buchnera sp. (in: enterobacteria)]|nr:YicC/YloC family endoribonuclease [Buchnera sp. (in: enterobacteria)]
MILSMTGYTSQDFQGIWGNATWEIRTLNQRYLEIYIRMPEAFRMLESKIRQYIKNTLNRGKIECYLKFNPINCRENNFLINTFIINHLLKTYKKMKLKNYKIKINFFDLLKWPGVIEQKKNNLEIIKIEIFNAFKKSIKKIINVRTDEGLLLKNLIKTRLLSIQDEIIKIRIQIPTVLKLYKEKLIIKLKELDIKIDDYRLEQEMLLLIQKSDITEELDRIDVHIHETVAVLNQLEPIGRRLDFMMQELNREINTIASKSTNSHITTAAIEIKVLIEQMREQIQNIE